MMSAHRRRRCLPSATRMSDSGNRSPVPRKIRTAWPLAAIAAVGLSAIFIAHPWQAPPGPAAGEPQAASPKRADFAGYAATSSAHRVADWAATSDAGGGPFIIIDKPAAAIYVFDGEGRVRGSAPVLLGAATGCLMLWLLRRLVPARARQ